MSVYRTIGPLVPLFYDGNNHLKRQQRNQNKGMVWLVLHMYTEQKKKRNNRPPRIFEFKGKTLIISGLLLYDFHSWDIRVYHARN